MTQVGNCSLHLRRYHSLRYATAAYNLRTSAVITLHFVGVIVYILKIIAFVTYDLEFAIGLHNLTKVAINSRRISIFTTPSCYFSTLAIFQRFYLLEIKQAPWALKFFIQICIDLRSFDNFKLELQIRSVSYVQRISKLTSKHYTVTIGIIRNVYQELWSLILNSYNLFLTLSLKIFLITELIVS